MATSDITKHAGKLALYQAASRWSPSIGLDRDAIARGILLAYANGEFDNLKISEPLIGFDYRNATQFNISKDNARDIAKLEILHVGGSSPTFDYIGLVMTNCVFADPAALLEFAAKRSFPLPEWLPGPEARAWRGGRPPAEDWPELEKALEHECRTVGLPSSDGELGWRTQADVIRWLEDRIRGDAPTKTTMKRNAKEMLKRIRGRMGQ